MAAAEGRQAQRTTVLWHSDWQTSTELCRLREAPGAVLEGIVLLPLNGAPAEVRYTVEADALWRTERAVIEVGGRRLVLAADDAAGWFVDGRERADLAGCVDVDLGVTPSTNTLPIRRLDLQIGERAAVAAAWVRFPDLSVERLEQRYERLGERSWRYRAGTFEAELAVDERGLVTRYGEEGLWVAVAARSC